MSRTDLALDGSVLLAALTRPDQGLGAVATRRRSLTALALATLASLLFAAAAVPRTDFSLGPTAGAKGDGSPAEELTPHQQEEARLQAQKVGAVAGYARAALGPAVTVLLSALALWLAFKVAGTRPDLKGTLAVSTHALLPVFLSPLLAIPAIIQKAPVAPQEVGRLLPSSLAALLPPGGSPVLAAAASSFDLFTLWTVVLLVLGMAKLTGATRRRATAVVLLLWAAQIALLRIAPAAAAAQAMRGGA